MWIPSNQLFALLTAVSFAAGLNLYATVATLGLLSHTGVFPLPAGLHLLSNWYVIAGCAALFLVELFADKIPVFDLLWNALHTFIRVPVAGLLAYQATRQLSPEHQLLATLVGAAVALAAHGGKMAARAAVTPSPEPLSNITLSLGEDAVAIGLTWLATRHPGNGLCSDHRAAGAIGDSCPEGFVCWCRTRTGALVPGLQLLLVDLAEFFLP